VLGTKAVEDMIAWYLAVWVVLVWAWVYEARQEQEVEVVATERELTEQLLRSIAWVAGSTKRW